MLVVTIAVESVNLPDSASHSHCGGDDSDSSPFLVTAAPLLAFSFGWACTRTCFHAYFPLLLARRSLDVTPMGCILTAVSLLVAVVQVFGFEPCRKSIGLWKTLAVGAVLTWFGLFSLLSFSGAGASVAVVIFWSTFYAAGSALITAALPALLVQAAPAGRCGSVLGIESGIVNFGRIIAPPLFGLLCSKTQVVASPGSACLGVACCSSLVAWAWTRKRRRLWISK
eukprot:TRINITY_DN17400_c0_g1_i3.p1 TRINITY_DN17400_c0_g1~~TRINITY_DN17400_c0_g1_i3.p1  ORF type:complete len:226 (-),score=23.97 TRINITY_DN17400_c0_g1_i3:131-808(-)